MNTQAQDIVKEIRKEISRMNTETKVNGVFHFATRISQKTRTDIFVDYSPHINALGIYGYSLGWRENSEHDLFQNKNGYHTTIYLDETQPDYKKSMETLDKVLEQLVIINALHEEITAAKTILGGDTVSLLVADAAQGVKEYIKTYIEKLQKM